jgi:sulfur relay protein TusB/DsrH
MSSVSRLESVATSPENTCLHLVLRSSGDVLDECLACIGPDDCIVLMDTAVSAMASPGGNRWLSAGVRVYCLEADLLAHGLGKSLVMEGMERVDDRELVELICRHGHCLSWK